MPVPEGAAAVTTTLPTNGIVLNSSGDTFTETGTTIVTSASGSATVTIAFDSGVISVSSPVAGVFPSGTYLPATYAFDLGAITITAVGNGTTELSFIPSNSAYSTVSIPVTVGGAADDQNFLNERGLARLWNNIDTLKQDKLTAGTNIAISANNTISAETGWKYLGQAKLASAGASLTFNLPAQYDNYKIVAAGEMASGSNATCQLQLLRSGSAIPSAWGVLDINGSGIVAGTRDSATDQFSMASCNQYDTINMEMTSFKTASTQWRKYQGYQMRMGSAYVMRQYNGRFNGSTEPNQVRIWTNATFGAGAVIKVWASNNT